MGSVMERKKSRLRRLRVPIVFLFALIIFDVLIRLNRETWEKHSPDGYTERVSGCAKQPRDIVFLGGSPVAEGIHPEAMGAIRWRKETYADNYAVGLSGGTTSDFYFAARHACPQAPKLLVYGITASDLNDNRHEPHGASSLLSWSDVRDWRATRPDAAEWVTRHYAQGRVGEVWGAYQYRHGLRMWAAVRAERIRPGCAPESLQEAQRHLKTSDWLAHGRGYAPTEWFAHRQYDQMKQAGWEQPTFEYLLRYKTGSHLKYLRRLLDWVEQSGTEIALVEMPVTDDLERRHPKEFAEFRGILAEVEKNRGVTVLRATSVATGMNDSHFADLIHPNLAGANLFSNWLKSELERLGREPAPSPKGAAP